MNSNLAESVSFCCVTKQPQSERLTSASWGHDNVGQQFGLGSAGQFFSSSVGFIHVPAVSWEAGWGLAGLRWSQLGQLVSAPRHLSRPTLSARAGLKDTERKLHFLLTPYAWGWHSLTSTVFSGPKLVVWPAQIQGMVYLFAGAAVAKDYRLGGLDKNTFIFSEFQRLEVQDQD